MSITIGSLFDGSGGFPLAGAMCGFRSVWASEVEPYPIAVTKSRLPSMQHLGDISNVNGANVEPVDIITFGSPCQGLSVAGLQKGLNDERSALFIEAVRIIKEMREATNGNYPKFAVWENVPGAFSSNAGKDFRSVLEELIKIVEPKAVMPDVPKKGWAYADSYCGNGWSLAYRVFDAQHIRTAQRRRRIYLVLDLGGQRARQILFERESLRGYSSESRTAWQGVTTDVEGSIGADDREGTCYGFDVYNQALTGNKAKTIRASRSDAEHIPCAVYAVENHPHDSRVKIDESGKSQTLAKRMGTGGGNVPMVIEPFCKSHRAATADDATTWKHAEVANTLNTFDTGEARANELVVYCLQGNGIDRADAAGCNGKGWKEDISYTLNTIDRPAVVYAVDQGAGKSSASVTEDISPTLACTHDGAPAIAIDRAFFNQGKNALYEPQTYEDGTNPTIVAKGPSAVAYGINGEKAGTLDASYFKGCGMREGKERDVVAIFTEPRYIVRRLTPTECARLQGFPDVWGHIDCKDDFTDEEYEFWLNIRNTHAEINGRRVRDYTKKQMLTWYNKLQTDSAMYKLWGNGIALPCALYVMEGIADVINK
ncbi:MAG: DNA cytosine methyltransferase [Clostridia bacterium]|nr:DNA cytosine methyltransferase [Clostridia bacterium]